MAKKIINYFFILFGFVSLGLGVVGIAVPVLPTTPFFLLTCTCFARGSTRFHKWFCKTKLYKNHLEKFITTKSLSVKSKLKICIFASIMLIISIIAVPILIARLGIFVVMLFLWFYFAFRIKTTPKE